MPDEPDQRVFELSLDHGWSFIDDLRPARFEIPTELLPLFATREAVEDLDELSIHSYGEEPPYFSEEYQAIKASPEELDSYLDAYAKYLEAVREYRERARVAAVAYEAIMKQAASELTEAFTEYAPIERELKDRSAALAAEVHAHREAARAFMEKREEAKEAALDAEFGPRVLMLYPPNDLDSHRQGDYLARVHLVDCGRRPKGEPHPVRAAVAVERLSDPQKWPNGPYSSHGGRHQMRVKLCTTCKPWTALIEHAGITADFFRKDIKLTEWPDALTEDLRAVGVDD